jgi:hypothetical protein
MQYGRYGRSIFVGEVYQGSFGHPEGNVATFDFAVADFVSLDQNTHCPFSGPLQPSI